VPPTRRTSMRPLDAPTAGGSKATLTEVISPAMRGSMVWLLSTTNEALVEGTSAMGSGVVPGVLVVMVCATPRLPAYTGPKSMVIGETESIGLMPVPRRDTAAGDRPEAEIESDAVSTIPTSGENVTLIGIDCPTGIVNGPVLSTEK